MLPNKQENIKHQVYTTENSNLGIDQARSTNKIDSLLKPENENGITSPNRFVKLTVEKKETLLY